MSPLWNRSSSLASSGGITNRTGSGTEEIYKTESSTPSTPQNSPSSEKGWWGKTWDWLKGEGGGKLASAATSIAGAGIGALIGGPTGAGAGLGIANQVKDVAANIINDGKFSKGLSSQKAVDAVDKLTKSYDIYKNDKLDKAAKYQQFQKLMESNTSNTSNGHIPVGYEASSSKGAIVSSGSTSTPTNLKSQLKKQEKRKSNTKKKQEKQKANPLMAWRKKQTNRNKRRNKK